MNVIAVGYGIENDVLQSFLLAYDPEYGGNLAVTLVNHNSMYKNLTNSTAE